MRHIGRVHVQAGQGVLQSTLAAIGYKVCTPCRHLVKYVHPYTFCPFRAAPQEEPEAETSATNDRLLCHAEDARPLRGTPLSDASPVFDHVLPEILEARINTVRHIPNSCRREFTAALCQLLVTIAQQPK